MKFYFYTNFFIHSNFHYQPHKCIQHKNIKTDEKRDDAHSEIHEMLLCVFYLIINMANIKCKNHRKTQVQNINFMGNALSLSHSLTGNTSFYIYMKLFKFILCVFNLHLLNNWILRRMKLREILRRMKIIILHKTAKDLYEMREGGKTTTRRKRV